MKFNRIAFLIAFLYIFNFCFSQEVVGPRSLSLAGNGVTLDDAYSVLNNVGLVSEIKEIQVATSYSIPYLINEFQQQSIVGVLPLKKGGISFGGQFTGKELFKQQKISIGYGLKLNEKLSIGIGLNHQQIRIQNYGVNSVFTADIGFLANVNEKLSLAASILSVGGNHSNINQERFPTYLQVGIRYSFQKQVQTYLSIDKSSVSNVNYKVGIEYEAYKKFYFRSGGIVNSKTLSFGVGYESPMRLRFDFGSQWQQTLGWTPHVGILYRFTAKK